MTSSDRLEQLYNSLADVEKAHSESNARLKELAPGPRRAAPTGPGFNGAQRPGGPAGPRRDGRGMGAPGAGGPRGRGGMMAGGRRGPAFGDLAERRGPPPRRPFGAPSEEDTAPAPRPRRLASAIVVDGEAVQEEGLEEGEVGGRWDGGGTEEVEEDRGQQPPPRSIGKRPAPSGLEEAPDVKKRNRRMFGALLGTLQRFRKDDEKLSQVASKRAEMLKKVAAKAESERNNLRQKEKEDAIAKREAEIKKRKELSLQAALVRIEINFHRRVEHRTKLSHFIFTKAEPPLLWLPKKSSKATDELLDGQKAGLSEWMEEERSKMEAAQAEVEEKLERLKQAPEGAEQQQGKEAGGDEAAMDEAEPEKAGQEESAADEGDGAAAAETAAEGEEREQEGQEEDDEDMVQEEDPEGLADVLS